MASANDAARLRQIDELLNRAIELADAGEDTLVAALISEAQLAVVTRFAELARHPGD